VHVKRAFDPVSYQEARTWAALAVAGYLDAVLADLNATLARIGGPARGCSRRVARRRRRPLAGVWWIFNRGLRAQLAPGGVAGHSCA
jgi:hypothetical protein